MIGQAERLLELNKLKTAQTAASGKGQIIAFSSGKGGTGKTFVSLNTAYALSKLNRKVLLIDLDSNLSNINIMLNIKPEKTLIRFFQNRNSLKELITVYEKNLNFIFGDSGRADYPGSNQKDLDNLLIGIKELTNEYDYIFLDIGAGAGEDIIYLLKNINVNILTINPEPTAIMDAYVIIKLLHNTGSTTKNLIIVNRCSSEEEGNTAFNNLSMAAQHFLQESIQMLGYIDHDHNVNRCIMSQELYIKKIPRSKVSMQIIKLAQTIVQRAKMSESKR
ncbi:MAG: AAA family ATPase [Bacillota bacterium]